MKYIYIPLFAFFLISEFATAQNFTLNATHGLPELRNGSTAWADFNNDGFLDLALTGIGASGAKSGGIYINTQNGTFTDAGVALTPVSDGSLDVADFNNDGLVDVLLTGSDASNGKTTKLYKNLGGNVFSALSTSLEGVAFGGGSFINITHDGKADIIINGVNNSNQRVTRLYRNNGNETFALVATNLTGTSNGDLIVTDFNNDSYDDILITGLNSNNQRTTSLYLNTQYNSFQSAPVVLPILRSGGIASADINADGYEDLFLSGNDSGGSNIAKVYINNAGSQFTLLKSLSPVADGGGAWGDFNQDGFFDLGLFGFNNPDLKTLVYSSSAGTDFTEATDIFPGASNGTVAWADYNNDSKLDLLINGRAVSAPFTNIYTNTVASANAAPGMPTNLHYVSYADSVVLMWDAPTDQETASTGLTYELRIGSSSQAIDIVSPNSNAATGVRKIAAPGKIHGKKYTIKGLPEGTYHWSLQAIDPSFAGSAFAPEQTFVSCSKVAITGERTVCYNTSANLSVGTTNDGVQWYSIKDPAAQIASGNALARTIILKDTLFAKVTKPLGCIVYDTAVVDVMALPSVSLGSDKTACLQDDVPLHVTTAAGTIKWFVKSDPLTTLSTANAWHVKVTTDTTLVVQVMDGNLCVNTDSIDIKLLPQPLANLGDDIKLCFNSGKQLSVGAATDSVNWFSKKKGMRLKASRQYDLKAEEDDTFWVEVYNQEGCMSKDSIELDVLSLPLANAGEDKLICDDRSVAIGKPGVAGLRFLWEPASTLSAANIAQPFAKPLTDTQYILHVFDDNNCESKDTVKVYLDHVSTIDTGGDKVICFGERVTLGGHPTASGSTLPYSFHWSPGDGLRDAQSANPQVAPRQTTRYRLQVNAGDCIIDSSYVTVTVNPLPVISAGEDIIVGEDESIGLHAQGGVQYLWMPEEAFEDNTLADPVILPNRSTTYVVKGTDANGCVNSDTVHVSLHSELFVPTLFTPNNDGSNDVFRVHGFGIEKITFKVYDRWGRMLFISEDIEYGWDGIVNGLAAEPGNYVWVVDGNFFDGKPLNYKGQNTGTFKLLR